MRSKVLCTMSRHYLVLYLNTNKLKYSKIDAERYNENRHAVTLVQYIPHNRNSLQEIKNNWSRFVQGYETLERDSTVIFNTIDKIR